MKPSREVREEGKSRAQRLAAGLYPHQVEGVAFLLSRRGAILADDMGLGKTRQAVIAMAEVEAVGPWLVVCPASVKLNWAREIELARPGSAVHVVGSSIPAGHLGWVIVNYELLKAQQEHLIRCAFRGVIFDEAHYLKNHTSQRSKLGRQLIESSANRPVTYLLTGTPITNRPRDLFPLLHLINHPLGRSFLSFAKRYCDAQHNGYGWVTDGASNLGELSLNMQGIMLRRTKEEVLDLPPKIRMFLDVEVPKNTALRETASALKALMNPRDGARQAIDRQRAHLLAAITKARHAIARAKVKQTIDYVEGCVDQGEKVIVFSCFDDPIAKVAEKFGSRAVTLTGKTPTATRQKVVDRFQTDESVRVFAANIVAGGIGINLTAARSVVFNDLDWVPANHWQAEDRAYRIGQVGAVHVAYMAAVGTIDQFVKHVLEVKARVVEAVIDGEAVGDGGGDVLQELRDIMRGISPNLPDGSLEMMDPAATRALLEKAAVEYRERNAGQQADPRASRGLLKAELLDLLANVLSGPTTSKYRCPSSSDPSSFYELRVDGLDVQCSCPSFEYRGSCKHAIELKKALATAQPVPSKFEAI